MPRDLETRLKAVLARVLKIDPAIIQPTAHFVHDLGMESVQGPELIAALEEEFDLTIPDEEVADVLTFEKSAAYLRARLEG